MPSPLRKLFEKTFKPLCVALVLVLATTTHSTLAAIRQSSDKIVDRSVENVLEAMPYAGLGLPSRLTHPNDCYVIVTAGAAYTDIKVLASPWESAPRLAERVNEALRGTPYAKDEAVWSADTYAAVQVLDAHGRFGTHSQTSSVAYGAIMDGMRRAGFTPHVLVRVPRYASTTGLPHAPYRTKNYRWYGEAQLRGGASFGVRADLNPISLVKICLVPSLVIVIGLVSLVIAVKVARSGRGKAARRSLITTVVAAPLASAFVGMFSILVMARD